MRCIFNEVTKCLYTLDHNMELPPDLIPPTSELARVPYFDFARALAAVRVSGMHKAGCVCRVAVHFSLLCLLVAPPRCDPASCQACVRVVLLHNASVLA